MDSENSLYHFLDGDVSFISHEATKLRTIYAPLCGTTSSSIKSSITPYLSGDIKIDRHRYLTKPVSTEDLRTNVRNFFVSINGDIISLAKDQDTDNSFVEIGQLWHKLVRKFPDAELELEACNFVPITGENVELMQVKMKNTSKNKKKVRTIACIPIFGRALSNKHDHEHVTSLLNRIKQLRNGVLVEPTMSFNEEGHIEVNHCYYVLGSTDKNEALEGTFPTIQNFYGEKGTDDFPEAVFEHKTPRQLNEEEIHGKEAVGGLCFKEIELKPDEEKYYYIAIGIADNQTQAEKIFNKFNSRNKFDQALEANKKFWKKKSHTITFQTGHPKFNAWMQWVTLQPILRCIYGCSFLPDHDYGKGGKGWRDLWQDLLSLIFIEPENVRADLINNFGGVRIDGSNATIIGSEPGEFFADRNRITRVWMDHGVWPFLTTLMYIDQTGDYDILLEENSYFKDYQFSRTFERDNSYTPKEGHKLKTPGGKNYKGTILEHILVQHLVQFFNVGEHNITRLESADWNDGLDMAFERGESVTFMSFYAGNLLLIADLLDDLSQKKNIDKIEIGKEIAILFDSLTDTPCHYDNPTEKKKYLFENYLPLVEPQVTGDKLEINVDDIISDLRKKGNWIFDHIRKNEKLKLKKNGKQYTFFNGYYDNKGEKVEGNKTKNIRMTLTGQVFPVMSGLANEKEISGVVDSVNTFLKDEQLGGYRLNTNFGVRNYLDLGRAFSFAYGTKENGAFFSHMTVMYAYALYKRGFAHEGYKVLRSIYEMCMDTNRSKIYPGVPEYFDSEGRGRYHYLTGSASWLVLTQLTQVFGVRGNRGDLEIAPKLVKEEFSDDGRAAVQCTFAGVNLTIEYINENDLDYGQYDVTGVTINGKTASYTTQDGIIRIERKIIEAQRSPSKISVSLGKIK